MIETIYTLSENIDTPIFYGTNNVNINILRNQFPNIQFSARGNSIKINATQEETSIFVAVLKKIDFFCLTNNILNEKQLLEIIKGEQPFVAKNDQLILHGVNGKNITARTENQQKLVKAYEENDLLFAIGPAGSGKTYTAIALAVRSLKNKEVKKIRSYDLVCGDVVIINTGDVISADGRIIEEEGIEACKMAFADEFIQSFPDKYAVIICPPAIFTLNVAPGIASTTTPSVSITSSLLKIVCLQICSFCEYFNSICLN